MLVFMISLLGEKRVACIYTRVTTHTNSGKRDDSFNLDDNDDSVLKNDNDIIMK